MVVFLFFMSSFVRFFSLVSFCSVFSLCSFEQSLADENPYKQYTHGLSINGTKPVEWNSVEGRVRLARTKYKKPFFALAHHFSGQEYPSTCGPASARIVLSAIYEKIGRTFRKDEQHSFTEGKNGVDRDLFKMTERNIFDLYNQDIISYDVVARLKKKKGVGYDGGIDLNQLGDVIASQPNVIVDYNYMFRRESDVDRTVMFKNFKDTIKYVCSNDDIYMIVLYNLTVSYDKQSGHYSPLVAYDEKTESVLIMDVASHLGTWIWVSLEDLFVNMNPAISGNDRGYIIVKQTLLSEEEKLKQMEAIRHEAEESIMKAEKEDINNLKKEEQALNVSEKHEVKHSNDGEKPKSGKNDKDVKDDKTSDTVIIVNDSGKKVDNNAKANEDNNETQKSHGVDKITDLNVFNAKMNTKNNRWNKKPNSTSNVKKNAKQDEKSFNEAVKKVKKPSKEYKEYNKNKQQRSVEKK